MTNEPSFGLVLDCSDPERLAPFWAAALAMSRSAVLRTTSSWCPTVGPARSCYSNKFLKRRSVRTECTSTSRWLISRISEVVSNKSALIGFAQMPWRSTAANGFL